MKTNGHEGGVFTQAVLDENEARREHIRLAIIKIQLRIIKIEQSKGWLSALENCIPLSQTTDAFRYKILGALASKYNNSRLAKSYADAMLDRCPIMGLVGSNYLGFSPAPITKDYPQLRELILKWHRIVHIQKLEEEARSQERVGHVS